MSSCSFHTSSRGEGRGGDIVPEFNAQIDTLEYGVRTGRQGRTQDRTPVSKDFLHMVVEPRA